MTTARESRPPVSYFLPPLPDSCILITPGGIAGIYGSPEGTWCDNLIIRPDELLIRPDELLNCHTMSLRGFRTDALFLCARKLTGDKSECWMTPASTVTVCIRTS